MAAARARVGIGLRAAHRAHRVGGAVLFVIGMQDEQHVERALEHRVGLVPELGHLEQHREQVAGVAELVVGIDVGQAARMPKRERRQRRHLADQPARLQPARFEVVDVVGVGIKRRQRADRAEQHPHRMRVVAEALHELLDILMHHRVDLDVVLPALVMRAVGQLALDDQVRSLEIVALLGELFDRISAIAQDALVAVDIGDAAAARRGVGEGRVVRHQAEVVLADFDFAQIGGANHVAFFDRHLVFLAGPVVGDAERVISHRSHLDWLIASAFNINTVCGNLCPRPIHSFSNCGAISQPLSAPCHSVRLCSHDKSASKK